MAEGRSAVDRVSFGEDQGEILINLRGWCSLAGQDTYRLCFHADDKEYSPEIHSRVMRKDVIEAFRNIEEIRETKGLGFVLTVRFPKDALKESITLKAIDGNDEHMIYSLKREELFDQMKENCVAYSLDKMDYDEGNYILQGWAITLAGKELNYRLTNREGKEISAKLKKTVRPDINRMFFDEPYRMMAGFSLEFPDSGDSEYRLEIGDGENKTVVTRTAKEIRKAAKLDRKHYIGFKEMVKATSLKDVGGDLKVLFRQGKNALRKEWDDRYTKDTHRYDQWIREQIPDAATRKKQKAEQFENRPKISIVVPAYHTPEEFLNQMVDSVREQTYENWELCIADGGADDKLVEQRMKVLVEKDSRIRYKKLSENKGISGNTNEALSLATGEYIALLDHDDILTIDALYEVVSAINKNSEAQVFYSDEDKVTRNLETYYEPHFKPDFNPNLLRSNNYICHLFVAEKALVDQVGSFDARYDGSQDYDFILRCTEAAKQVVHIPKVLYHWRVHNASTAANSENKMYCFEAGQNAIKDHLKRKGIPADVEFFPDYLGYYQVKYHLTEHPLVSIIIPNKDEKESLELCVRSILNQTTYDNYEILIVENNSTTQEIREYYKELETEERVRILYWKSGFNYSAINNFGVKESRGDYLLFLNNDTEVLEKKWLEILLADCMRENIGITGVKLLYPDMTMQHCGVTIGLGGVAGHIFTGYANEYMGGFGRAHLQQNVSAVTAACMMVRKSAYDAVGGFEEDLAVAFNDVDFCLKVRKAGYDIMYEPLVTLKHYESKSRGTEDTPEKQLRFQSEVDYMQKKWKDTLKSDPFYSKNMLKDLGYPV